MGELETQDERRGFERRVSLLERNYAELSGKVDRVGSEQAHQREMIDARFRTLEKGQELVATKLDGLSANISLMASDSGNSPAGRALQKEIGDLEQEHRKDCEALHVEFQREVRTLAQDYADIDGRVKTLETGAQQVTGGLKLARAVGFGALAGALVGIVAALKALGVIP